MQVAVSSCNELEVLAHILDPELMSFSKLKANSRRLITVSACEPLHYLLETMPNVFFTTTHTAWYRSMDVFFNTSNRVQGSLLENISIHPKKESPVHCALCNEPCTHVVQHKRMRRGIRAICYEYAQNEHLNVAC